MAKRPFNGSPTVDGYYTTFDSSEVHRIEEPSDEGGGSSDFSTAEVTVVNNCGYNIGIEVALVDSENLSTYTLTYADTNTTVTISVILYKGSAFASMLDLEGEAFVEAEGDAEVDGLDVFITGDCTITIS